MTTYLEIQKQIEALQRQAEELRLQERKGVIERMKEAVSVYGITATELGLKSGAAGKTSARDSAASRTSGRPKKIEAAAYSDSKGNTWGGRGKRPNWLREALDNGAKLEDFAVQR